MAVAVLIGIALEVSDPLLVLSVVLALLGGIGLDFALREFRFRARLLRTEPGLLELWQRVESQARRAKPPP